MKAMRTALVVLALLAGAAGAVAQTPAAELLLQAKAAYNGGERSRAEALFLQVLEVDPDQSAAYYYLGLLAGDPAAAVLRLRQYAKLEPGDAWGWLALGNAWLKMGRTVEALEAFRRASDAAPEAADVKQGLAKGRLRASPAIRPLGGLAVDSDGTLVTRGGLGGDVALRGGFRLGGLAAASRLDDGTEGGDGRASIEEALVRLEGRPSSALRLDAGLGAARFSAGVKKADPGAWVTPEADLRLRWRAPAEGPWLEARLLRKPLASNPLLVRNRAVINETRMVMEAPAGPFRIRGSGRAGWIETAPEKANPRFQAGLALVRRLGPAGEVSLQAHRLGFARASSSGYFAPRAVETIEAGTYWELGGNGAIAASFDLGAGIQRLARQGESVGPWKAALRGWGTISIELLPSLQASAEAEAYSAPFAPAGAATAPGWKYLSVSVGLTARLR